MPDENLQSDLNIDALDPDNLPRDQAEKVVNSVKAVRKERDEIDRRAREMERKLKEYEQKYGNVDLDAYQEFLTQKEQAELKRLEDQQEFQTLKQRYEQEKAELAKKTQQLETQLQHNDRRSKLKESFLEHGGKRGSSPATGASYFELVEPYLMQRTGVIDGKLVPVDRDGLPDLKYGTVDELLADFANDPVLGAAFEPRSNAAGGGAQNSVRGRASNSVMDRLLAIKNPAARLAEARKLGIPLQ